MEIIKDNRVFEKYQIAFSDKARKQSIINEIDIHSTAGGGTIPYMLNPTLANGQPDQGKIDRLKKGIGEFHFLNGLDGKVTELLDPKKYWCYHSTSGGHDLYTIGIENSKTDRNNNNPLTEAQYDSLFELIFDYLMIEIPTITRITSHRQNIIDYSPRQGKEEYLQKYLKNCPGTFDWDRLHNELARRGYGFSVKGDLIYGIKKIV